MADNILSDNGVTDMAISYEKAIDTLLDAIVADYKQWYGPSDITDTPDKSWRVKHSKVYSKVIEVGPDGDRSVWGFIARVDNPKKGLIKGDIAKAASWNAPAKGARGNIYNSDYTISCAGPSYKNTDAQTQNEISNSRARFDRGLDDLAAL